jgi:dTMP kinase
MALFITFEGGEGSGKSTQAKALYRKLDRLAIPALLTHEPGVTSLGNKVERWLKWAHKMEISPVAELLLFNVSRSQLVAEVIKPALESGRVVVCDRYYDSTTAYQGYGRGLDLQMVNCINRAASQGVQPDLTVFLDMDFPAGMERKGDSRKRDRFEQEKVAFHRRVQQGYLELAAGEPGRWLVIDAAQPKAKIAGLIWQRVSRMLNGNPGVEA